MLPEIGLMSISFKVYYDKDQENLFFLLKSIFLALKKVIPLKVYFNIVNS